MEKGNNETFDLNKLNRPSTYEEARLIKSCPPCSGHDKESSILEAKERLNKVKNSLGMLGHVPKMTEEHKKAKLELFSTKATKFDEGKPSFTSIPQEALLEVARGFTIGKNKYGMYNYSGEMDVTRYLDALSRHLNQYLRGESIDESGIHHLGLVACNALMALDGIITGKTIENLNPVYKERYDSKKEEIT